MSKDCHIGSSNPIITTLVILIISDDFIGSSTSERKSRENSPIRVSSIKSATSKDKSSESDTSVTEDLKTASIGTEGELPEESIASMSSSLLKVSDASIAEEYADDTFESTATKSQAKKLSLKSDSQVVSSTRSLSEKKKYSKESEEYKSEDETSVAGEFQLIFF